MALIPEDLTVLEVLGIAVKKEIDAGAFYREFAARINNPLVHRKIQNLAEQEDEHAAVLRKEYQRMTGGEEPAVPDGFQTGIKKDLDDDMTPEQLLEMAMEIEKKAAEYYREAAKRSEDPRGRDVLEYLARFEDDHFRLLETELEQVKRSPDWFEQESDLIHFGP
jgi:rubrerythrin